jgi:mycothiol synthase
MPGWTRQDVEIAVSRLDADPVGTVVAHDGGEVVGYCIPRNDDLTVHPRYRRRGHGRRLVGAARALVAERGLEHLSLHVPLHLPGSRDFATALGFEYRSSLWLFRLPGDRPAAAARLGPAYRRRAWRIDEEVESFVRFVHAAWEGHPAPIQLTPELARHVASLPGFDPEQIIVLEATADPGTPIGFAKCEGYDDPDGRLAGYISQLAVLPAWRGRGLGRELLRAAVAYLRRNGTGDVELAVEASNDAALHLYRSEGFEPAVEWPHWTIPAIDA